MHLARTPEAQLLAELLVQLPAAHRRALVALSQDEGLQLGVLKAALEHWPEDVRTSPTEGLDAHAGVHSAKSQTRRAGVE